MYVLYSYGVCTLQLAYNVYETARNMLPYKVQAAYPPGMCVFLAKHIFVDFMQQGGGSVSIRWHLRQRRHFGPADALAPQQ